MLTAKCPFAVHGRRRFLLLFSHALYLSCYTFVPLDRHWLNMSLLCVVNISWRGAARSLIVAGCRCRSSKESVGPLTGSQNGVEEEERLGWDRRWGNRREGNWVVEGKRHSVRCVLSLYSAPPISWTAPPVFNTVENKKLCSFIVVILLCRNMYFYTYILIII